jgi:hypothetical protein
MNIHDITKQIRAFADDLEAQSNPEQPAPFNLPPPPPGMQWHRTDGWTAEMLPPGTRPLVRLEPPCEGDEQSSPICGWIKQSVDARKLLPDETQSLQRTTRPLLFQHEGHEWTWHRAGDPCPCAEKQIVQVLLNDGSPNRDPSMPEFWDWEGMAPDDVKIIGWRYADAVDPYAELKVAHAAGKVIQIFTTKWEDWPHLITPEFGASPDQYRIKPDDSPPWIEHKGGPCPLRDDEVEGFEFKIRTGKASGPSTSPSVWRWTHEGNHGDIIAYRVLKTRKPAPKQPLGAGDKSLMKFKLWSHLHNEHGLTLIDDELHQIIRIVREVTP